MTFHNLQNGSVGFSCSAPQHRAVRASQLTAAHGRGDGRSMTWNNTGQIWPPKPIRDGRFCIYHTIRRTPPSRAWTSNFADLIVGHPSGSVHALIWQITMDKRIVIIGVAYLPESSPAIQRTMGLLSPLTSTLVRSASGIVARALTGSGCFPLLTPDQSLRDRLVKSCSTCSSWLSPSTSKSNDTD